MPPCNCSGKRRPPLGAQKAASTGSGQAQGSPQSRVGPGATQTSQPGAQRRTQSFTLTTSDGRTQTFGSRLEAQAARVRAGGGIIR